MLSMHTTSYQSIIWDIEEENLNDHEKGELALVAKILRKNGIKSISQANFSQKRYQPSQTLLVSQNEDSSIARDNRHLQTVSVKYAAFNFLSNDYLFEVLTRTLTNEQIINALLSIKPRSSLSFAIQLLAFQHHNLKRLKAQEFDREIVFLFFNVYQSIEREVTQSELKKLMAVFPVVIQSYKKVYGDKEDEIIFNLGHNAQLKQCFRKLYYQQNDQNQQKFKTVDQPSKDVGISFFQIFSAPFAWIKAFVYFILSPMSWLFPPEKPLVTAAKKTEYVSSKPLLSTTAQLTESPLMQRKFPTPSPCIVPQACSTALPNLDLSVGVRVVVASNNTSPDRMDTSLSPSVSDVTPPGEWDRDMVVSGENSLLHLDLLALETCRSGDSSLSIDSDSALTSPNKMNTAETPHSYSTRRTKLGRHAISSPNIKSYSQLTSPDRMNMVETPTPDLLTLTSSPKRVFDFNLLAPAKKPHSFDDLVQESHAALGLTN